MIPGSRRLFVTLGMFIIDDFEIFNGNGDKIDEIEPQIGGGTYTALGARIWLTPNQIGMIVDRGRDFPEAFQTALDVFGRDMWLFRNDMQRVTTRATNIYRGDHKEFKYLTPRRRLTPVDLNDTPFEKPASLHFICSPTRAKSIIEEARAVPDWQPVVIYEPIPYSCVPGELPALRDVLQDINILSPNSEEALSLLSMSLPPTRASIEAACARFLEFGIGANNEGHVVIRSGELGAYVASRSRQGQWVDAFWTNQNKGKVVDVTGAGNSFLGGLAAGLALADGDVFEAAFYAAVSASFTIEQQGLPKLTRVACDGSDEEWNGDSPFRRLNVLRNNRNMASDLA